MKKILLFFPFLLFATDFISNLEYGKMLYENPRGIGCIKCHGKDAKGRIIATYIDDKTGEVRKMIAPNIQKISWVRFYHRLRFSEILKKGKFKKLNYSIMPNYTYLVDSEIRAIFLYIQSLKGKK